MDAEEHAVRIAQILSQAMNALCLVESARNGIVVDGQVLRQTLAPLIAELQWLDAHRTDLQTAGLQWPVDAPERIERLSSELDDWNPPAPPAPSLLIAGDECLSFARGS